MYRSHALKSYYRAQKSLVLQPALTTNGRDNRPNKTRRTSAISSAVKCHGISTVSSCESRTTELESRAIRRKPIFGTEDTHNEYNGVDRTKRANEKQQELVCVIPAITKNQDESRRLRTISKGGEATKQKSYDTRRIAKAPLTAYAPKKDQQRIKRRGQWQSNYTPNR